MTTINQAIKALYETFSDVPKPKSIVTGLGLFDEKSASKIIQIELIELQCDDLENYVRSVFLTAGDLDDFQYYLPRILELMNENFKDFIDPEIVFSKLRHGNWKAWRSDRQNAVSDFISATWENELNKEQPCIDELLCSIGQCEDDLSKYLDSIRSNMALIEFVETNSESFPDDLLVNPFWEDRPKQMMQVIKWMKSENVQKMICLAYGQ